MRSHRWDCSTSAVRVDARNRNRHYMELWKSCRIRLCALGCSHVRTKSITQHLPASCRHSYGVRHRIPMDRFTAAVKTTADQGTCCTARVQLRWGVRPNTSVQAERSKNSTKTSSITLSLRPAWTLQVCVIHSWLLRKYPPFILKWGQIHQTYSNYSCL